jgi:hypothetical protein
MRHVLDRMKADAGIKTDAELARRLKEGLERRGEQLERGPDSLTQEIRRLRGGRVSWFANYRAGLEVLAEILDVEPNDLLPNEHHHGSKEFDAFPALLPLPRSEPAFTYGRLRAARTEAGGVRGTSVGGRAAAGEQMHHLPREPALKWAAAPAGAGKSFAVTRLANRTVPRTMDGVTLERRIEARSVARLADAQRLSTHDGPLVLEVGALSGDPAVDWATMRDLTRHGDVTVLARFARPGTDEGWRDWEWVVDAGERRGLLECLRPRCPEGTLFDAGQAYEWLEEHDPDAVRFATMRDLLVVANALHQGGPSRLKLEALEGEWDRHRASPQGSWPRDARRALVRGRLSALRHPARGGLDASTWAEVVAETGRVEPPAMPAGAVGALLEQHRGSGTEAKEAARKLQDALTTPSSPARFVEAAAEHEVLQVARNGGLDVEPGWLREAVADAVAAEALGSSPTEWSSWCLCPERRRMVDRALDHCPDDRLAGIVGEVVDRWDPEAVPTVAALEAVARSCARRLPMGGSALRVAPLSKLAERLWLGAGHVFDSRPPLPAFFGLDDFCAWVATCWSFSLHVEAPEGWRGENDALWLFPGWHEGLLPVVDAPGWLRQVVPVAWGAETDAEREAFALEHLMAKVAGGVTEICDFAGCDATPRCLLYPRILEAAGSEGATLSKADLDALSATMVRSQLRALHQRSEPEARDVGRLLWRSFVAHTAGNEEIHSWLRRLDRDREAAQILVLDALDEPTLRASLAGERWPERGLSPAFIEWLPSDLRETVLAVAVDRGPGSTLREFIDRWGRELRLPARAWERLLEHPDADWQVARDFRAAHPERARELLSELPHDDRRLELLLNGVPASHGDVALRRLQECPTPDCEHRTPARLARLIERRPDLADEVYPMLRQAQEPRRRT